jgi:O-antigen ligase
LRSIKPFVIAWVVGFGLLSVVCLYDTAAMLTGREMLYPGILQRLRGPFRTSAQLAGYSMTSFFILLAGMRLLANHRWLRTLAIALTALAPLFVVLASRRSASVALLLGFAVLIVVSKYRTQILLGAGAAVGCLIIFLALMQPEELSAYMAKRVEPLIGKDPQKIQIALDHFQRGVSAFKENPVLGVGFGAFSSTRYGRFDEAITHEQHSGYLAILSETGAVGFAVLMFLHLAVLYQVVKLMQSGLAEYRDLGAYLLVLFAALAASELYNRVWRERSLWIVLGIVVALRLLASEAQAWRARKLPLRRFQAAGY